MTGFHGRREILTDVQEITQDNLEEVLNAAVISHAANAVRIEYLYNYRRGIQPILYKEKEYRPEINNKVIVNRAEEIVAFKTGYLLGEPVQYVSLGLHSDTVDEEITRLNSFMLAEDKYGKDKELADWIHTCGLGYRYIIPKKDYEEGDAPFGIYILDPRNTFTVKRNTPDRKVLMGVTFTVDNQGITHYTCYTENLQATVTSPGGAVFEENPLGMIPIIEYKHNSVRMGAFEAVLSILDAINLIESTSLDNMEQVVQALMLFHNVDISKEDFDTLRERGALKFRDIDPTLKGEIKYIMNSIDGVAANATVGDLYDAVLTICGMPNRNGGSSTSDTGKAVNLRDGWASATSRAADSEAMFKTAERKALRVFVEIANALEGTHLKASDIDISLPRRNYENITEKANVLLIMLQNPKIHPRLAFEHCGMFVDPDRAYEESMEYYEECLERGLMNHEGAEDNTGSDSDTGSDSPQGESSGSEDGAVTGRDNRTKAEA